MSEHLMNTYGRLPVTFARGEGVWLWDTENNKYFDAMAGVAVCSLGHCHAAVTEALRDQAGQLIHTSNWYRIGAQEQLADKLCQHAGMDEVFFCNSGAEANEAAIKLARLYGHQQKIKNPHIIVTEGSFHGRTLATLSATGSRKVQAGFEPLVSGFVRVPFNDIEAINHAAENNNEIVAILVEPVEGEGGIIIPDAGYLKALRKICDQRGWLLMIDEIQTGMCRSGKWFAYQHENILPDVCTVAKALGNGVPIGACLASGKAANLMQPGNHASTYGGNPLACRAALAVIDTMASEQLDKKAASLGKLLLEKLTAEFSDTPQVSNIRGLGLLIAFDLDGPCTDLMEKALAKRLLINVTAGQTVRLLPPLILGDEDIDILVERLTSLIKEYVGS
ncbi:MAG: aspartate aminotransferase family protein [Acidiferrobacterales bacterium]